MKTVLVLGLVFACSFANANFIKQPSKADSFPDAESYKTAKPVQVKYVIQYSNTFEEDENTESYPERDKNGLYVDSYMELKALPSKRFPKTSPTIYSDLPKILKINEKEIVQKFKGISRKTPYYCLVTGQMNAQFKLEYDGRDFFRFPDSVSADVKSATPIGKPVITCQKG
ncbi:hypothetical protein HLH17_14595 [Acinetobacter sp. ANC 5380]|uniref:Uncharacterized protein n=1 Tax=Acinetobacter terrae TaxID=2731247 RepID=A0A7Y2RHH9_9GAMM|nr:hypothetical protein [Acinetobacter terrae]NNH78850.1 hypothetical protein [Acinetobacter terrae]